jgi:hypothetical protein
VPGLSKQTERRKQAKEEKGKGKKRGEEDGMKQMW